MADERDESTGTVLLAGGANLAIAVAKLVGGLISGSAAMLAEAAHSFADTLNQVFLLTALRRSRKPADAQHPFGYGMERYFWSLLAAVGIFVLGAGYSIMEGVRAVLEPEELGSLTITYVVLGASFVFEGVSWLKAVRQLGREADEQGRGFFHHLRVTPDPTAKTVAFEDTAALVGIVLAALGIFLHSTHGAGLLGRRRVDLDRSAARRGRLVARPAEQERPDRPGAARGDPGRAAADHPRVPGHRQRGRADDHADGARRGDRRRARRPRRQRHRRRARAGGRRGRTPAARGAPRGASRLPRPDRRAGRAAPAPAVARPSRLRATPPRRRGAATPRGARPRPARRGRASGRAGARGARAGRRPTPRR